MITYSNWFLQQGASHMQVDIVAPIFCPGSYSRVQTLFKIVQVSAAHTVHMYSYYHRFWPSWTSSKTSSGTRRSTVFLFLCVNILSNASKRLRYNIIQLETSYDYSMAANIYQNVLRWREHSGDMMCYTVFYHQWQCCPEVFNNNTNTEQLP